MNEEMNVEVEVAVEAEEVFEDETIVCAQCGKEAKVPFQPSNDRPVYCSECYAAMKAQQ